MSFFLGMISHPSAAVVPEGTDRVGRSWRAGAVGTGPFRVVDFEPERGLELERHPTYWREGLPKSQALAFSFGGVARGDRGGFPFGTFLTRR